MTTKPSKTGNTKYYTVRNYQNEQPKDIVGNQKEQPTGTLELYKDWKQKADSFIEKLQTNISNLKTETDDTLNGYKAASYNLYNGDKTIESELNKYRNTFIALINLKHYWEKFEKYKSTGNDLSDYIENINTTLATLKGLDFNVTNPDAIYNNNETKSSTTITSPLPNNDAEFQNANSLQQEHNTTFAEKGADAKDLPEILTNHNPENKLDEKTKVTTPAAPSRKVVEVSNQPNESKESNRQSKSNANDTEPIHGLFLNFLEPGKNLEWITQNKIPSGYYSNLLHALCITLYKLIEYAGKIEQTDATYVVGSESYFIYIERKKPSDALLTNIKQENKQPSTFWLIPEANSYITYFHTSVNITHNTPQSTNKSQHFIDAPKAEREKRGEQLALTNLQNVSVANDTKINTFIEIIEYILKDLPKNDGKSEKAQVNYETFLKNKLEIKTLPHLKLSKANAMELVNRYLDAAIELSRMMIELGISLWDHLEDYTGVADIINSAIQKQQKRSSSPGKSRRK